MSVEAVEAGSVETFFPEQVVITEDVCTELAPVVTGESGAGLTKLQAEEDLRIGQHLAQVASQKSHLSADHQTKLNQLLQKAPSQARDKVLVHFIYDEIINSDAFVRAFAWGPHAENIAVLNEIIEACPPLSNDSSYAYGVLITGLYEMKLDCAAKQIFKQKTTDCTALDEILDEFLNTQLKNLTNGIQFDLIVYFCEDFFEFTKVFVTGASGSTDACRRALMDFGLKVLEKGQAFIDNFQK